MVDVVCEECSKTFRVKRSFERRPVRYCSMACRRSSDRYSRASNTPEVDEALARELEEARRMRAEGKGWNTICRRFGRGKEYFQTHLVPGFKEHLRQRKGVWRAKHLAEKAGKDAARTAAVEHGIVPPDIVAEIREKHAAGTLLTSIPAVLSVRGVTHKAVAAALEGR
jgi:hypothetical protein